MVYEPCVICEIYLTFHDRLIQESKNVDISLVILTCVSSLKALEAILQLWYEERQILEEILTHKFHLKRALPVSPRCRGTMVEFQRWVHPY